MLLTEAVVRCRVPDEVAAEVKRHFDDAQYVELTLTAGFYSMVVRMLESLRIELDDDIRDYAPKLP